MSRTARLPRRVLVPAVAALVAGLALTGCAAGQISQTADQVSAIDGASGTVGNIGVRNALLATPAGSHYAKGANVPLQMYVSNAGITPQTLTSITTPAANSVRIGGKATVPAQSLSDFTGTGVKITLVGLTSDVVYGKSVPVTFNFSSGSLTINVPVEIPAVRTTGRPDINIQPSNEKDLWQSGAPESGGSGG